MATTPPSISHTRTPPTPLHGAKYDTSHVYATRRSTRPSTRIERTTPPRARHQTPDRSSSLLSPGSKRTIPKQEAPGDTLSPPSSKQASPRKKTVQSEQGKRHAAFLDPAGSDSDTHPFESGMGSRDRSHSKAKQGGFNVAAGMLPTPAKTPRKRSQATKSNVGPTARVLFSDRAQDLADVMPTPRRRAKKDMGLSLASFAADDGSAGEEIHIYTDSKDRVPEHDASADNPFLGDRNSEPEKTVISKTKKSVGYGQNEELNVNEMVDREDGMVYVFRGKKVFRKFDDSDDPLAEGQGHDLVAEEEEAKMAGDLMESPRRVTRSSIKPRLLFPTQKQRSTRQDVSSRQPTNILALPHNDDIDEEAPTDIDELAETDEVEEDTDTVMDDVAKVPLPLSPAVDSSDQTESVSPETRAKKQKTHQAAAPDSSSPPSEVDELALPTPKRGNKRARPFDKWRVTKPGARTSGSKRGPDTSERHETAAKRARL